MSLLEPAVTSKGLVLKWIVGKGSPFGKVCKVQPTPYKVTQFGRELEFLFLLFFIFYFSPKGKQHSYPVRSVRLGATVRGE